MVIAHQSNMRKWLHEKVSVHFFGGRSLTTNVRNTKRREYDISFVHFYINGSILLLGLNGENKAEPVTRSENTNPRLNDPNPDAWNNLPMELVISDFQKFDGIFSSFICDEINRRIKSETLKTLQELETIDKRSRVYAFSNCFSPEANDYSKMLDIIRGYSNKFPELVGEIVNATK